MYYNLKKKGFQDYTHREGSVKTFLIVYSEANDVFNVQKRYIMI